MKFEIFTPVIFRWNSAWHFGVIEAATVRTERDGERTTYDVVLLVGGGQTVDEKDIITIVDKGTYSLSMDLEKTEELSDVVAMVERVKNPNAVAATAAPAPLPDPSEEIPF